MNHYVWTTIDCAFLILIYQQNLPTFSNHSLDSTALFLSLSLVYAVCAVLRSIYNQLLTYTLTPPRFVLLQFKCYFFPLSFSSANILYAPTYNIMCHSWIDIDEDKHPDNKYTDKRVQCSLRTIARLTISFDSSK